MDKLTRTIDQAIEQKDFNTLSTVFSSNGYPDSWQSVGPGEQRSIAAHFIHKAVTADNGFLDAAVNQGGEYMISVMTAALSHLPATVEGAADNTLRKSLFERLVSQEEYIQAARILGGMRMEDDRSSVYYMPAVRRSSSCIYAQVESSFGITRLV
jgi:hypothetical protein